MPFVPSDRVAWLSYLDRTRHLFRKLNASLVYAMFGSDEGRRETQNEAARLLTECRDVEDRLGLPHVNEISCSRRNIDRQDIDADEIEDNDSLPADEVAPPDPEEYESKSYESRRV